MKRLLKRLELICLVLMLCLSMTACGEKEERETSKISKEEKSDKKNKDDDEEEEDEDEDEKKSSKEEKESEKESVAEATPEPTADPQEEQRKYDEEALEILGEAWVLLDEFFSNEDMEMLEEVRTKLEDINSRKCSKEVRRLLEENELILNDAELILEWSYSMIDFGEEFSLIFNDMDVDNTDFANLEDIEEVYNQISYVIEECEEMEVPQFIEYDVKCLIDLMGKYQTLLVELYKAIQNEDVLTVMSANCFENDMMAELGDLMKDIEAGLDELETHTNVYLERFQSLGEEFALNMEIISEGDYDSVEFPYLDQIEKTKVTSSISCIDTIYPAMYNRLQAVAIVNLSYVNGEKDVLVTVEVDGFSQKYEKTMTINQFPQRYYIKPPVLSSGLNLDNQKNTQIKVTITDVETGNIIASETENVKIMSINDFILSNNEYGYTDYADILAWVTPESNYIQELLRIAADYMEDYTGYHGIAGYQPVIDAQKHMITAYQVYAIQKAISDIGVRYVMSSYSIGEATNATQRVNRPDETLLSKSGICIETSVLMASALQAAGFNSMIVLTTGHCQVAVETWNGSGDYLLIETTLLPVEDPFDSYGSSDYINRLLSYLDDEQWMEYIENNNGIIYSCNLATYMGIIPLAY